MDKPDIRQVERCLVVVLKKKRREAIGYTVLTVLCTPTFVVLASLVALVLLGGVMRYADYDVDARGIYTGINVFLAYMMVFVLRYSNPPDEPHRL